MRAKWSDPQSIRSYFLVILPRTLNYLCTTLHELAAQILPETSLLFFAGQELEIWVTTTKNFCVECLEEWFRIDAACQSNVLRIVIFFFPYNPPPTPTTPPPGRPTPETSISVRFGSVWLRLAPFGPVSGPFRVCFGSVSGCWVGSGRGRREGLL